MTYAELIEEIKSRNDLDDISKNILTNLMGSIRDRISDITKEIKPKSTYTSHDNYMAVGRYFGQHGETPSQVVDYYLQHQEVKETIEGIRRAEAGSSERMKRMIEKYREESK